MPQNKEVYNLKFDKYNQRNSILIKMEYNGSKNQQRTSPR